MEWITKSSSNICNVAFTTIHQSTDDRYFNSGCSRHMTKNQTFFTELKECILGHVTFNCGARENCFAKGNILKPNLLSLHEVRLVEGLVTNLISIINFVTKRRMHNS